MGKPYALADGIPRDTFWKLPSPQKHDGLARLTGVEIEFSGLTELEAAEVVETLWGGKITERAPHVIEVAETEKGTVRIELDTAWTNKAGSALADKLLELSREVIPVEIVTAPLLAEDLPEIDRLMGALESSGALGSQDGVLLAFGVHLNTEVASQTAAFIIPVVQAFAFIEQWLRSSDPPDVSRRVLPFIDPWPWSFVNRCAEDGAGWSLDDLCGTYLDLVRSRNHGLDLLPLLEQIFPDWVRAALPEGHAKGGRPTWHYRLPETGMGSEGWSIAYEWNRWVLVERVASDAALLSDLADAWTQHRSSLTTIRPDWAAQVEHLLRKPELWHG
ncbi:amidoligase family protein [Roseovarius sp.]|uniref:amidoligase family protein n=1 Tax=Roseovarius sp. TaxID=1486281 RepID=UPI003563EF23